MHEEVIESIILDEQRNHQLITSALIQFLSIKGVLDFDEFKRYLDDFSLEYVRKLHPDLFSED